MSLPQRVLLKNLRAEHPLPRPIRLADRQSSRRNPRRSPSGSKKPARQVAYHQASESAPVAASNTITFYDTEEDDRQPSPPPRKQRDQRHLDTEHQHHRITNSTITKDANGGSSYKLLEYRNPPFFITFISIFQLCTFVYYAFRAEESISLIGPVPFKSKLIFNPYRRYEIWRYLTYMLIHAGYWHIVFNILVQMAIGVPLETVHSFTPVFIVYTGGVIGGALGNSVADPHTYLAGASSGCYALIAAHLSELIMNWNEIGGACLKLITFLLFCSADIATAVYERHYRGSIAYRTSYGGHLAGAVSGLLLGLVYLHNAKVHRWESKVSQCAVTLYVALIVSAVAFNIFYTDYFPLPDTRAIDWLQSPYMMDREH